MKGFPKTLKTKEDYYNCLAMVAAGELAAADLQAAVERADKRRFICCAVVEVAPDKRAATVRYCDEARTGLKFVAGNVTGTITAVTHQQSEEGQEGNDLTALTLSKAVAADAAVINLEVSETVDGMTVEDINALKGVLRQYE